VLVGVAGSGKSTWVRNQKWLDHAQIISSDHFIEKRAQELGQSYSQVFPEFIDTAVSLMLDQVAQAAQNNKDIVWDQTSLDAPTRKKKLDLLKDYRAIAVVFFTPDEQELQKRLSARPGKIIPASVVRDMTLRFSEPTLEEGFSEIWYT